MVHVNGGGTILGRPSVRWLAVISSALNVAVVVFGVPLTGEQVAALNGFASAVIALIAHVQAQQSPTSPDAPTADLPEAG